MELGLGSNAMEIQAWHAASKPSSPAGQAGAGVGAHVHSTTSCQPPSPASKLARGRRGDSIDSLLALWIVRFLANAQRPTRHRQARAGDSLSRAN